MAAIRSQQPVEADGGPPDQVLVFLGRAPRAVFSEIGIPRCVGPGTFGPASPSTSSALSTQVAGPALLDAPDVPDDQGDGPGGDEQADDDWVTSIAPMISATATESPVTVML